MKKLLLSLVFNLAILSAATAQNNPNPGYWQQHADYKMEVSVDVKNFNIQVHSSLLIPTIQTTP
jgi:hypothetical protein